MSQNPMLDQTWIDDEVEDDEPDPEAHKKANKQLQSHLKKVEAENAALRGQLVAVHITEIGLDPEKGLGKAITKEYQGDISAEAVATFAREEYGHEAADTPAAPPEVAQAQNIDTLNQGSATVTPPEQPSEAELAEQRMHDPQSTREDATAAIAAKAQAFAEQHYPQGTQT